MHILGDITMTYFTVSHVGTCLSCYLTDHHNRDGEYLIGVPVDNSTTFGDIRDAVESEAFGAELPDNVTDEMISAAIAACFERAKADGLFDSSLDEPSDDGEGAQAWFLLEWDSEEEADEEAC